MLEKGRLWLKDRGVRPLTWGSTLQIPLCPTHKSCRHFTPPLPPVPLTLIWMTGVGRRGLDAYWPPRFCQPAPEQLLLTYVVYHHQRVNVWVHEECIHCGCLESPEKHHINWMYYYQYYYYVCDMITNVGLSRSKGASTGGNVSCVFRQWPASEGHIAIEVPGVGKEA